MTLEFNSAEKALEHTDQWEQKRYLLPTHDLHIDTQGRLTHGGSEPIKALEQVSLTDTALTHLNGLAGLPRNYATDIEPELHAHSLNKQLKRHVASLTLTVESSKKDPEKKHIAAVTPGATPGVDNAVILQRILARELSASVCITSGLMQVRFGDISTVEVLPSDTLQVVGTLHNERWSNSRAKTRPMLEIGIYLNRLVCSNGAYTQRVIAEGKLMSWATRQEIQLFLDRQLNRVLTFQTTVLKTAVERMSNAIPTNVEEEAVKNLITRAVGVERSEELLSDAISVWDHLNAVTATANLLQNPERRRKLQIEGGRILERFLI